MAPMRARSTPNWLVRPQNRMRAKAVLLKRINVIWPVQSLCKNISVPRPTQITSKAAPSRPTEGRFAIVTNAGRDAMDADGAADEQR